MKKLLTVLSISFSLAVSAQEASEIKPAEKGVVYGSSLSEAGQVITPNDLQAKMVNNVFEGKITGKVKEVCKTMGCWITLEKNDGTTLMVKSKDHGFFMPQNLAGKTVVVEGAAAVKEVSEEKRKHLAEDAGKSKKEINKIKGSEKQLQFIAKGIQVVD
jgi:hypothetical protein